MPPGTLHFIVRTPHAVAVEIDVHSIRIPTESGQVGLRPQIEPQIIAVEAGLVLVRNGPHDMRFIGTAGGLLVAEKVRATLMTPLALSGADRSSIMDQLQKALGEPNDEMQARAMLANLEEEIISEMRGRPQHVERRGR
jgi:F0F1-type ATP synthase epsilon subunit